MMNWVLKIGVLSAGFALLVAGHPETDRSGPLSDRIPLLQPADSCLQWNGIYAIDSLGEKGCSKKNLEGVNYALLRTPLLRVEHFRAEEIITLKDGSPALAIKLNQAGIQDWKSYLKTRKTAQFGFVLENLLMHVFDAGQSSNDSVILIHSPRFAHDDFLFFKRVLHEG